MGKKLKQKRIKLGLSIEEMCIKSGLKYNTVYKLETGRVINPTLDTILKVCTGYEMTLNEGVELFNSDRL